MKRMMEMARKNANEAAKNKKSVDMSKMNTLHGAQQRMRNMVQNKFAKRNEGMNCTGTRCGSTQTKGGW